MKQQALQLWHLGWWTLPVMVIMGSPWIPVLSGMWGTYLPAAKEAMQVAAPVLAILVTIGAFTGKPKNDR